MTTMKTAERFPTRGDTVTLITEERRQATSGQEIDPLVYEVDVLVTRVHPDESLVIGTELTRFCYIKGYREKGTKLPPNNPYGNPKSNGYQIGIWQCIH